MRRRAGHRSALPLLAVLVTALLPASGAAAATVVNGDFESGTLSGWHVHQATQAGNWFAYEGTEAPIGHKRPHPDPVQAPPQGTFAAVADEADPDTLILYQDVSLAAGSSYRLSLFAYYNSYAPLAVPTPDTLSVSEEALNGQHNQQFRIDVMKPEAPLESLDPSDILLTVFQTKAGGPEVMTPTKLTADLTPFAGQTVRLRIAAAVHEEVLNAGVDAVQIVTPGAGGPSGPSSGQGRGAGRIALGRPRANRRNGTVALPVRVPAAGVLQARGLKPPARHEHGPDRKAKPARSPIRAVSVHAERAGTVILHLAPSAPARRILERRHRLRARVVVSFLPKGGGERSTAARALVFRLATRRQH